MGVQIHGGMGFIEETGAAQYYRDARIAPIYEGTNGIQAMDLVGRKLSMDGGESAKALIANMKATLVDLGKLYSGKPVERFATAIEAVKRRNLSLGEFIDRFTRVVKMPAPELRPVKVKEMVDDILWLNREGCASRGIRLGWRRCDEVPPVALDAQLMEGALLNIVKNAVEAVAARQAAGVAGGYVELSLERGGDEAVLAVVDSADLLGEVPPRQLFTPFFSTKQGGQGIGLMFVREVLMRHGLAYSLASTGNGETRFAIRFTARDV